MKVFIYNGGSSDVVFRAGEFLFEVVPLRQSVLVGGIRVSSGSVRPILSGETVIQLDSKEKKKVAGGGGGSGAASFAEVAARAVEPDPGHAKKVVVVATPPPAGNDDHSSASQTVSSQE